MKDLHITLPNILKSETMYTLLGRTIDDNLQPKAKTIELDFTSLRWIEPSGVTVLSNLVLWLDSQNVNVVLVVPEKIPTGKFCPIKYLDDSQFFYLHTSNNQSILKTSKVRSTTLSLQWVTSDISYQWVDNKFAYWLAGRLGVNVNTLGTIKMCILEILNNIRDHAKESIGCIFAQHYPSENCIRINISDFGVGIPNTIRRVMPNISDDLALRLAIKEGFTSQSLPSNRGAGLHTLLENVVISNGGSVKIHSNHGILTCFKAKNGDIATLSKLENRFYPGTFIEIELKTDSIQMIQDEEEEVEVW
jgi:anti-sigma regulatory factor (Ser/Thr protein kinase)